MLVRLHVPELTLKTPMETLELPKLELPKLELPKLELPTLELPRLDLARLARPAFLAPKPRLHASRRVMALVGLALAAAVGAAVAGVSLFRRHLVPEPLIRAASAVRARFAPTRALVTVPAPAAPDAAPLPDPLFVESGEPC